MTNASNASRANLLRKFFRVHLILHPSSGKTVAIANSSTRFEQELKASLLQNPKLYTFGNTSMRITVPTTRIEMIERVQALGALTASDYDFYVEDGDDVTAG